jgi:hypothetical protein
MSSAFTKFSDCDFKVTRHGIYPRFYVINYGGQGGTWIRNLDREEIHYKRWCMRRMSYNHPWLDTTITAIEDKYAAIAMDIDSIQSNYPAYYDFIVLKLWNNNTKGGQDLWYEFLYPIVKNHASTLVRGKRWDIHPTSTFIDPFWDERWSKRKIIREILDVHFKEWYVLYCKQALENHPPEKGIFFKGLEMILFITTKLVDNKYDTIKFEIEHSTQGRTKVVTRALEKARENDTYRLNVFWLDPNYKTNG